MMKLVNEDWGNVKKRWEAWWDCDIYDRVLLQVYAPKKTKVIDDTDILKDDNDPDKKWADMHHIIKREKIKIENTYYGGEALPFINPNWSVGNTCFYGCKPHFAAGTVWVDPLPLEQDGLPRIKFDKESYWWKWIQDFTEEAARQSCGKYYLIPEFGNSAADTLAMIRDSQVFMFDMIDNPEWVKSSQNIITEDLNMITDKLWEKMSENDVEGYLNWNSCWSPRKTLVFDADVSSMVSPSQYKELMLPLIVEKMSTVEYRQYHVDGEALAKAHLDTLLGLPELQALQWMPGDGRFEIMQWLPLIKKVQEKKKSLQVYATPEEIIPLLKEVRPEGLCISTNCSSEDQARKLVETVEKLYK